MGFSGLGGQVVNVKVKEGRSEYGTLGDSGLEFDCFGGEIICKDFLVSVI